MKLNSTNRTSFTETLFKFCVINGEPYQIYFLYVLASSVAGACVMANNQDSSLACFTNYLRMEIRHQNNHKLYFEVMQLTNICLINLGMLESEDKNGRMFKFLVDYFLLAVFEVVVSTK